MGDIRIAVFFLLRMIELISSQTESLVSKQNKKQKIRLQSKSPDQSGPLPHPPGNLRRMRIKILKSVRIQAPSPGSNALNHTSSAPQAPVKHSEGSSATQTNDPSAACTQSPKPPSEQKPRAKESPPLRGQKPGKQRKQRRLPTPGRNSPEFT